MATEEELRRDLLDAICNYTDTYQYIEFNEPENLQKLPQSELETKTRLDVISRFLPSQFRDEVEPVHIAAAVAPPELLQLFEHRFAAETTANHLLPLHFALAFGRRDNAELLRTVKASSAPPISALQFALFGGVEDFAEFDYEKVTARTELMYAAMGGRADAVRRYLDQAGAQDEAGYSALMFAAHFGRREAVELLAEREAGLQEKQGMTATMFAAQRGDFAVVEALRGKELRLKNKQGYTALMIACQRPCAACAELLLGDAGLQNSEGETALMLALDNFEDFEDVQQRAVISSLIKEEQGMQTTAKQYSALMVAAENNDIEAVKELLDREGKLADANGNMAVNYSIAADGFECFDILLPAQGNRTNCQELLEFCKLFSFDDQIKEINKHLEELDKKMKEEQEALFD